MKNRLAEIRELRGLTQRELAERAGTTPPQISKYESDGPSGRLLNEESATVFARILRVQPGDLMPLITDGSAPLSGKLASHEKALLAASIAKFMEIHTDYEPDQCQRLGLAAVKMYQMAQSDLKSHPFFDLAAIRGKLALDQSTNE
jgi:transcriptional regulator with XRE-family HTH domain